MFSEQSYSLKFALFPTWIEIRNVITVLTLLAKRLEDNFEFSFRIQQFFFSQTWYSVNAIEFHASL